MAEEYVINLIKKHFGTENIADIPLLRGGRTFKAHINDSGIFVDNLANEPFLP